MKIEIIGGQGLSIGGVVHAVGEVIDVDASTAADLVTRWPNEYKAVPETEKPKKES